jgi:hypothetical protein
MAVETTVTCASSVGNGVTVAFSLPFYFIDPAHIVVTLDGVVQTGGYNVAGTRAPAGGTATFTTPPALGVAVGRRRVVPDTQPIDTQNNQTIFEDVFDDGLDRRCMVEQQLETQLGRALQFPEGEEAISNLLPSAADRAGKVLTFDGSGAPLMEAPTDDNSTYTLDTVSAPTRTVYLRLRDSISFADIGMRDDAVSIGVAGFDNTALLSELIEYAATRRIPMRAVPCGYGGRFYVDGSVPLKTNLHWVGEGGKILAFGRTNDLFQAFNGETNIIFDNFELDGDLKDGSSAPEVGAKILYAHNAQITVRGGRVNQWNGGWGWAIDGNTDVEGSTITNHKMLASCTDSAIWLGNRGMNHQVTGCVVTGDKNRILANNVYVDDRILVTYHNLSSPFVENRNTAPMVSGNYTAFSHAAGVKIGGSDGGIVNGNQSYCTSWSVDVVNVISGTSYEIWPAHELLVENNQANGSRTAGAGGGSTSHFRFQSVRRGVMQNNVSRNTAEALAEPDGDRCRWGVFADSGCSDLHIEGFKSQGAAEVGISVSGTDTRILNPIIADSGGGAISCTSASAGGYLEIVGLRARDLFRTTAGVYRVIEINGASGLTELEVSDGDYKKGVYNRSVTDILYTNGISATPFEHNNYVNGTLV